MLGTGQASGGGASVTQCEKRSKVATSAAAQAAPSGLLFGPGLINFSWPCRPVASPREAFEKVASVAKNSNTPH